MEWKLADAKNKFSEVINKAVLEGPQRITRRGEAFIVLEESLYKQLTGGKVLFTEYLCQGPSLEEVPVERDPSPMRDCEL